MKKVNLENSLLRKPSSGERKNSLAHCSDDQGQRARAIAVSIYEVFEALNTFGMKPEQLEKRTQIFQKHLIGYSVDQVEEAFKIWIATKSNLPAPADIIGLIERGGKPEFSNAMYVQICQKPPEHRDSSDWDYIKSYEAYHKSGGDVAHTVAKYKDQVAELRAINDRKSEKITELQRKNDDLILEIEHLKSQRPAMDITSRQNSNPIINLKNSVEFMMEQNIAKEDIRTQFNMDVSRIQQAIHDVERLLS